MSNLVAAIIEIARAHQDLAYVLVVLLAMSEALPVFGAFIPGTAVILGISALVPSGAVGLWPTMICTTIGALLGDGISYGLGRRYHRAITMRWPLNRHPELIAHGEALIKRHGGKSVFIARFMPGVRAVVPLIAGILFMTPARFFGMNVLAAVVWAPAHVLAGALIGASLAVLGAVAGRLVVLLIVVAVLLGLVIWAVRRGLQMLPPLAMRGQDRLLTWAQAHDGWVSRQVLSLLDPARREVQGLAVLGAVLVAGLWVFFGVLQDIISGDPLVRADAAVFHFLQSLRSGWADQLMVAVTELGDGVVVAAVTIVALVWLAWRRAWRAAVYWVAAVAIADVFALLMKASIHLSRPAAIFAGWGSDFSFPSGHATVNAALYGFLIVLAGWETAPRWRPPLTVAAALLIATIAFSRLYLGGHRLSAVLAGVAFGIAWAAILGIAYLRRRRASLGAGGLFAAVGLTLLVVGSLHIARQHGTDMVHYAARERTSTMSFAAWWQGGWSKLPARRVDLLGEFEEPLTMQWAGHLADLRRELLAKGWHRPVPWTIRSTLAWLDPHAGPQDLPVLPHLENGRQEGLIMVRDTADRDPTGRDSAGRLVLRLWRSDIALVGAGAPRTPLWIGTVVEERIKSLMSVATVTAERDDMDGPRGILALSIASARLVRRDTAAPGGGWDGAVLLGYDPRLRLPGQ